jgi:hypothetical protein
MESLDIKIREWLARYLANEISIQEFQDRFVPTTWEVEKSNDVPAIDLAHEIDLRMAEFSNGHWTEAELRDKLRPLVESYTAMVSYGTQTVTTGHSATTTFQYQPVQHVDIVSAKICL